MMSIAHSSAKKSMRPAGHLPNWLIWTFVILSFIGFLDSSYLTINHYTGAALKCTIFEGCEQVTNSVYATVFGVPVALLGAIYYLTILILALLYSDTKNKSLLPLIMLLTVAAFIASLYFTYLQVFVIKAICQYCILSAITSTLLFICGLLTLKYTKETSTKSP